MKKKGVGADETHIKGLGFCSNGVGSNTALVDVKDGKILRTRPMDFLQDYSPEDVNMWSFEARGKTFDARSRSALPPFSVAYKKRAVSKNRVPYPMKRVDWDPDGKRNAQNRGKSKFVRISWDEAIDIIAKEIRRQYDLYGAGSILAQQDGHGETKIVHGPHGCQTKLLEILGGCTVQARQADSWEGWYWGAKHVWSEDPIGQGRQGNTFYDISLNTELLLGWGCDQETTPWGWGGQVASQMSYWFSDLGIKQVYICPDLNYAAAVHADKWIPIYPNTDLALQFAIAYVWLSEGLYDREYIDTHTIGFDWLEYEVMGGESGVPKTPEWASEICGVPVRTIKALARQWHKKITSIMHCNGGSYIRGPYSHEPARMEVCLLAMQGLGAPGRNYFKFIEWGLFGVPESIVVPKSESSLVPFAGYNGAEGHKFGEIPFIPKTLIPEGILATEPFSWYAVPVAGTPTSTQFDKFTFPKNEGDPYLHMIWTDSPCWSTCWNGGNSFLKAITSESLEFVLVQHPWFENDCLFADLILPTNTKFEERDVDHDADWGGPNALYVEEQCIEPYGESVSDWEAVCLIADKLGVLEEYTGGRDVAGCIEATFNGAGAGNYIKYDKFLEQEYVLAPFLKDWKEEPPGFRLFYDDPENFPLATPSGKLEVYSPHLAEYFPDDKERMPYPHYIEEGPSHQESRRGKRAEKYPFLMVSNHPRWRVHAQLDDITWLREIAKMTGEDGYGYEPVWVNPKDAEVLGVKTGDVLRIYNERGWVLGGVRVTERIRQGCISQDHGSRLDPIENGVSDRGGANNLICPTATTSKNCCGEATSGFLVGVEKADIDDLRNKYPDAFSREFDVEGVKLENWLQSGMVWED
ncbi:molybdopterin-dependent oxidoreductase [Adlercreutzia sp. ZJ304]|uniref:molybdopterin-dependent oxidoreductase n=1 Tax=Adlercreutzia sp. ZJ304 TaxID=2709791 RepID=UPI0013EBE31E|nr:molybdopterin-dependent oxidoreductase [Adlercreutzia sp. ZJ304]